MQPPPARKGPYLKTLKHVHTEQVARLQAKNQHECDLLEDIRNFTKQRSVIEKTYAEALLKISSAYLNKKIPSIPDLRDDDEDEKWNVWNVWRTVLEENEKLARARLAAVEVFQQQITDDAKTIRQAKLAASKKCLDQLQIIQKELQLTVSELDRTKKFYFEEEHMAHDARVKASDAEEKLKKKKGSIFSSFTSLQRSSVKLSSKKETCEEKSTGARNEYLMALAQANAHQDRYYNVDLDHCLRTLEGDVYDKLREYLTVIGRTELLTCSAAQNSFTKIRDQAQMLSRDYNVACCVQYYPVLKQNISYPFDPCDGDNTKKITAEHVSISGLTAEVKNWANKIGKYAKVIKENQRKLRIFQDLKDAGHKSDPDDPNGPDIDIKIDEIRENIRKNEIEKLKAESVFFCFRDAGLNVDEFMKDIEINTTTTETIQRSKSSSSINKGEIEKQQNRVVETYYDSDSQEAATFEKMKHVEAIDSPEPTEVSIDARVEEAKKRASNSTGLASMMPTWDDPMKVDWGDDNEVIDEVQPSPPPDITQINQIESWQEHETVPEQGVVRCVALYSYNSQNPDELSILENEHLELLGEGDGDGWIRARNYKGEEGYIPQNYVEVEGPPTVAGYPLQPQISFSSVDYHVQDPNRDAITEQGDHAKIRNGYPEHENYFNNENLPEEIPIPTAPTTVSSGLTTPFINECRAEEGNFCRALYDYEATAPEELSFCEGQIIRVINFTPNDAEDGWWEGEYEGQRGVFPAIVCDECHWDGEPLTPEPEMEEEDVSESGINPPCYTPPKGPSSLISSSKENMVESTLDEDEDEKTTTPKAIDASSTISNFEMELNSDQQQKYQSQFDESQTEATIIITEAPTDVNVEITVTESEEASDRTATTEQDDAGLEVTQIVITAATPMSEEHKGFPSSDSTILEEEEPIEDQQQAQTTCSTDHAATEQEQGPSSPDHNEFEAFADFSEMNSSAVPDKPTVPPVVVKTEDESVLDPSPTDEAESQNSISCSGDDPSSISQKQFGKYSLEIEENDPRFLRGQSGEGQSPVTPEELDLHNLAKLESLKESDA